jgi:hypothetical protein
VKTLVEPIRKNSPIKPCSLVGSSPLTLDCRKTKTQFPEPKIGISRAEGLFSFNLQMNLMTNQVAKPSGLPVFDVSPSATVPIKNLTVYTDLFASKSASDTEDSFTFLPRSKRARQESRIDKVLATITRTKSTSENEKKCKSKTTDY